MSDAPAAAQSVSADASDPATPAVAGARGADLERTDLEGTDLDGGGDVVSILPAPSAGGWDAWHARHAADPAFQGLRVLRVNRLGVADLRVPAGASRAERAEALAALDGVEAAWVPGRGAWADLPDDPEFAAQWHLRNTGASGGTAGADVDAEGAWSVTTGDPSVVVAILDSGVSIAHPDLAPNVWHNADEVLNGVDDDGNGLVDDLDGWDFFNDEADVTGPFFHGTRVAGMVAARNDDGFGVASLAGGWGTTAGCRVMAIGVGDSFPDSSILDDAILYAIDEGARIVNLSLTVPQDPAIDLAIGAAAAQGVLVFAAAGNNSAPVAYPASHPDVVAVAATSRDDSPASFTNFGPEIVFAAPGDLVETTSGSSGTAPAVGTSFASPLACAAAALLYSHMPGLSPDDAVAILVATCDDIDAPGPDVHSGAGRIDAGAALALLAASDCNGNGVYDPAEIAAGTLSDLNGDGVPDVCALGMPLCFGDGSTAPCPCGNEGAPGAGCANSTGMGAVLSGAGSPVTTQQDFELFVEGARASQTGVFLRGASATVVPFKDGVLCAGNPTERLSFVVVAPDGSAASGPDVEDFELLLPGDTLRYQFWYRDPVLSPCGSGSNVSNAFEVDWL